MSTGLLALLKDVSLIAKTAAASLDDITTASLKATSKSVGLVIDDAAVTPKYVVGFSAEREIPIIQAIALGSLKNKFYFICKKKKTISNEKSPSYGPIVKLKRIGYN